MSCLSNSQAKSRRSEKKGGVCQSLGKASRGRRRVAVLLLQRNLNAPPAPTRSRGRDCEAEG